MDAYKVVTFVFRRLIILSTISIVISCGGESSDGGEITITSATSYQEYKQELTAKMNSGEYYKSSLVLDKLDEYNFQLGDFSNNIGDAGIANPFIGTYENYVQPGQGSANEYPTPNGRFTLEAVNSSYSRITSSIDLTNGQTIDADFKFFYGVQDYVNGSSIPVLIVLEGLVRLDGVPQYRALNVLDGGIVVEDGASDPSYNGPGSLVRGLYSTYALEAYNGGSEGYLGNYFSYMVRVADSIVNTNNDTFNTATFITADTDAIGLEINPAGDIDYYTFTPISSGTVTFETTGNTDTFCSIYNSSQSLIVDNDDSGSNANCLVSTPVVAGQTYYLSIRGFASSTTGGYDFKGDLS